MCLDIVEGLFDYVFEEPSIQYAKAVEMNEALKALPLPEAPGWLWSAEAAIASYLKRNDGCRQPPFALARLSDQSHLVFRVEDPSTAKETAQWLKTSM